MTSLDYDAIMIHMSTRNLRYFVNMELGFSYIVLSSDSLENAEVLKYL